MGSLVVYILQQKMTQDQAATSGGRPKNESKRKSTSYLACSAPADDLIPIDSFCKSLSSFESHALQENART